MSPLNRLSSLSKCPQNPFMIAFARLVFPLQDGPEMAKANGPRFIRTCATDPADEDLQACAVSMLLEPALYRYTCACLLIACCVHVYVCDRSMHICTQIAALCVCACTCTHACMHVIENTSTYQSINHRSHEPTNQSTNQPTHEPRTHQPTNPMNPTTDQLIEHINPSVNHPINP